jgi:DNA polymerase
MDPNAKLAELTARTRQWAQARAAEEPALRVRLAQPIDAPGIPQAVAEILNASAGGRAQGGTHPKPPFADTLEAFQRQIAACEACPRAGKRKKLVYGEGHSAAPLVFIGEGPSSDDDASGRPFTGASGDLLDRMVAAMGFKRADVYLVHVVKCRGLGNEPTPAEVAACLPYLKQQLSLLKPKALVSFGPYASGLLTGAGGPPGLGGTPKPMAELRGRWAKFKGIPLMPTYHPEEILRDEGLKRFVWADLKLVMKHLQA